MQQTLRPYVAAGVALVGAGVIAATPVVAAVPNMHVMRDVALVAESTPENPDTPDTPAIDFTSAWESAFETAKTNSNLLGDASDQVSKALQDAIDANKDLIAGNRGDLADALTFMGGDPDAEDYTAYLKESVNPVAKHTLDSMHNVFYTILNGTNPIMGNIAHIDPFTGDELQLLNFAASPLSGVLIGTLAPSISPLVSAINSVDAIQDALSGETPDTTAALQELVNLPAGMVNGFLNGATLDLTSALPAIEEAGLLDFLPEKYDVTGLSYAFGGLFSTGDVDKLGDFHIGGSLLNGVGVDLDGVPLISHIEGVGVGPFAALIGMGDILTTLINELGADAG